jgi:hypothetical protein
MILKTSINNIGVTNLLGLPDKINPNDDKRDLGVSDDSLNNDNIIPAFMTIREFVEFKRNIYKILIRRID